MSHPTPILITGIHRSGTTWTGRMVEFAPQVHYLYEPFNDELPPSQYGYTFPTSYHLVDEVNGPELQAHMEHVLGRAFHADPLLKQVKGLSARMNILRGYNGFRKRKAAGSRPLMKDPHALFAAPWLAEQFGAKVLILIRHPAAFALSLKKKNWPYDFENLTAQPRLMESLPDTLRERVERAVIEPLELMGQAGLLWSVVYDRVDRYRKDHPDWMFQKHEEAAQHPGEVFEKIYAYLELPWDDVTRDRIIQYSLGDNTVYRQGNSLKRDSAAIVQEWKDQLSIEEIQVVHDDTKEVFNRFYGDEDWKVI